MKKIAVFFPGIGYHCDKPLLYYAGKLAAQAGYDEQIKLTYRYEGGRIRGDEKKIKETIKVLYEQTVSQLTGVNWEDYDDILFVSKSIGTATSVRYAREMNLVCKNIYYTPLEITFMDGMQPGIVFTGTDDPWVKPGMIQKKCEEFTLPVTIIKEANHSLETKDTMTNLKILTSVMDSSRIYLQHAKKC